jgi:hypothetical protein
MRLRGGPQLSFLPIPTIARPLTSPQTSAARWRRCPTSTSGGPGPPCSASAAGSPAQGGGASGQWQWAPNGLEDPKPLARPYTPKAGVAEHPATCRHLTPPAGTCSPPCDPHPRSSRLDIELEQVLPLLQLLALRDDGGHRGVAVHAAVPERLQHLMGRGKCILVAGPSGPACAVKSLCVTQMQRSHTTSPRTWYAGCTCSSLSSPPPATANGARLRKNLHERVEAFVGGLLSAAQIALA